MLTPHFLDLIQAALLASFWRKKALDKFLRRVGVAETAMSRLHGDLTKRAFLDWLFPKLEATTRGQSLVHRIANELVAQLAFPDLEGWEDAKEKKAAAVAAVSNLRSWLEREENEKGAEERRRARRASAEQAMLARVSFDATLSGLRKDLDLLAGELGTQRGGYDFQKWFGKLCALFELDYKKPYRYEGRETDGSLTVGDMTYLLSLKFEGQPTPPGDVDELKGRLHNVAEYTMGIFLSMAGFTPRAIETASGSKASILLFDHTHLYHVLSGACTLGELVARVRRHASRTGEAYLSVPRMNT